MKEKGVKIFYEPVCIFVRHFDEKAVEAIHVIDPKVSIERVNMWENPEMARQRGLLRGCVYINGKPMTRSIFEADAFKKEARDLLNS